MIDFERFLSDFDTKKSKKEQNSTEFEHFFVIYRFEQRFPIQIFFSPKFPLKPTKKRVFSTPDNDFYMKKGKKA
jgi:hypothetical protein